MAFRFDKLTIKAQEAVAAAQSLAADRGHAQIDPLHLLAALLAQTDGIVGPMLDRDRRQPRRNSTGSSSPSWAIFPRSPAGRRRRSSQETNRVLEAAQHEADAMKDEFVSTEHLLLALTKVDSKAKNILKLNAITDEGTAAGPADRPRQHAGDRPEPRGQVPGPANATASIWSNAPGRASSIR